MTTLNRINLIHQKAIGSAPEVVLRSRLGNFNNVTRVTLVGYSFSGHTLAIPNHLLMRFSNGSTQCFTIVQDERNTVMDVNGQFKMLYPSNGVLSQYRQELLSVPEGSTVNLQGTRFYFEQYDTTTNAYKPYTDYTEVALELEVEMFSDSKVVKRI